MFETTHIFLPHIQSKISKNVAPTYRVPYVTFRAFESLNYQPGVDEQKRLIIFELYKNLWIFFKINVNEINICDSFMCAISNILATKFNQKFMASK